MAIRGLRRYAPEPQVDHRGSLTVMHVGDGADNVLKQLNVVRSEATTLRGIHAHSRYAEHYVPIVGRMFFVVKDARQAEPSFGEELSFWVDGGSEIGLEVPAGVAHGVYFDGPGVLVYGLSSVWTGANEYGCRWNDPAIATLWPTQAPTLSERDSIAGSFDELVSALNADLRSISR